MSSTSVQAPVSGGKVSAVVGLLVFFELASGIVQGAVAPLLPDIGRELGIDDAGLNWVVAVQLLSAAVSVPVFGRLGDLYGHRRLLRIALLSMSAGSVLVALAPSLEVMLVGRLLQGPLAALLPLEIGLVRDRLDGSGARRAIGYLVGSLMLGAAIGTGGIGIVQSLGDSVTTSLGVVALAAVLCSVLAFTGVPESRTRSEGTMDWTGAATLSTGLVAVLFALSQGSSTGWTSPAIVGGFAGGAALLALWVVLERRCTHPLVDVRDFARWAVTPHYFSGFVVGFVLLGTQGMLSVFLASDPQRTGYGFGLPALQVGLMLLGVTGMSVVSSTATGRVAGRLGYRTVLVAALVLVAVSEFGLALLHGSAGTVIAWLLLAGLGFGFALGALPTVIVENSPQDRTAIATALYNNLKTLGGSVGGALAAAAMSSLVLSAGPAAERAHVLVWVVCGAGAVLAGVLTLMAPRHG